VIPYRIGVQQRVFPAYRAPFFDALAKVCAGGLSVFAGEPLSWEALGKQGELKVAQYVRAENMYLGWGSFLMVWQRGLKDWLERWYPDVLIMEAKPRNVSTNMAVQWMHGRKRPVIGWGLGAPPVKRSYSKLFSDSRKRFLAQFDALVSYSKTGVEQYIATGVPSERVFLAPNAATPRPTLPVVFRADEYKNGRPVVLFVGRLQPRKRVDVLIRACSRLPQALQPRLVIVGDGPARADFEHAAQMYFPETEFVGMRQGDELLPYYNEADLFVLPGTGGLAIQQAMSHGLPVIVAEADGTQSELVREKNGWLISPGDEDGLVKTLEQALSDPCLLRIMGRESYRIVSDEVNLEKMVEVFAQVVKVASDRYSRK